MRSRALLRPHDVGLALQLVLTPDAPFRELAERVGLSVGEVHGGTRRLEAARLLEARPRAVRRRALVALLSHGIPHVFPGWPGADAQGVPTAHAGPALDAHIPSAEAVVWPSPGGPARGAALTPLLPRAAATLRDNPALYRWLTLVDALRIGRPRERALGERLLEREIMASAPR